MLTPYDEFPVHQAPYPFSRIPSTDYNWDDGYYVGAFGPKEKAFLATGLRINPNSDMIGGYAMINVAGIQYTVRFSRCWRRLFDLRVGPFRYEFLEPLRKLRLVLEKNESELQFDLIWEGVSPPVEEHHHTAFNRGKMTTDQTRYSQPGKVEGSVHFKGKTYEVEPQTWSGSRDHSWGLYAERPPLAPISTWLPPKQRGGEPRAMRFWTCFRADPFSGFFHVHETTEGKQSGMSDVFGAPPGGQIFRGWSEAPLEVVAVRHEMEFRAGTRILTRAVMHLEDQHGGSWTVECTPVAPAWVPMTIGYHPGSWKDGGTFHTYHGSEELAFEWDEFDFSEQPVRYTPYQVTGAATADDFGMGFRDGLIHGVEYLAQVRLAAPDGSVCTGSAHIEHFINGPYRPYGFV